MSYEFTPLWLVSGKGYRNYDEVAERVTKLGVGNMDTYFGVDDSVPQMDLLGRKVVFERRFIPPGHQTPLRAKTFLRCSTVEFELKKELFRASDTDRIAYIDDILKYLKEIQYAD